MSSDQIIFKRKKSKTPWTIKFGDSHNHSNNLHEQGIAGTLYHGYNRFPIEVLSISSTHLSFSGVTPFTKELRLNLGCPSLFTSQSDPQKEKVVIEILQCRLAHKTYVHRAEFVEMPDGLAKDLEDYLDENGDSPLEN